MPATPRPARVRRTVLAVPGSSDRFIAKARTLAVDTLFLDLEDAVAHFSHVGLRSAWSGGAGTSVPVVLLHWRFRSKQLLNSGV